MNSIIALIRGRLNPDRTISLGRSPQKKKRREESLYDREHSGQKLILEEEQLDYLLGKVSLEGKFCSLSENPNQKKKILIPKENIEEVIEVLQEMDKVPGNDFSAFYDCGVDLSPPLFIESHELSRDSKKNYGSNGITRFGQRVVRNGSLLLEKKYGKKRLGFVTCTLANFPEEIHKVINAQWSEITRRFYQKVKRQLEKVNEPFLYVGVTEIQEKRFEKYGVPCPHLHFVYLARKSEKKMPYIFICHLHRAWNEAVQEGIALGGSDFDLLENNCRGSVHAKWVRKSAGAYLGKYMSKGTKVLEKMQEEGWTEFPRQWWTASKEVKAMYKSSIVEIPPDICSEIFYNAEKLHELCLIQYYQDTWIDYGGFQYRCGLSGIVSQEFYDFIVEAAKNGRQKKQAVNLLAA